MAAVAGSPLRGGLRWLLVGLLLGAAGSIAFLFGFPETKTDASTRAQPTTGGRPQPVEGSLAPDFTARTVEGDEESVAAHVGEVILVNFWATWCGPCRTEMPALEDRYRRYRGDGFTVLAVNFDEPAEVAESYGLELGLSFPLLLDPGGRIQSLYEVRGYPSSYFVDRQGVIQIVHIGLMTERQLDDYLGELGIGS